MEKQKEQGRVQIFVNGMWHNVMDHPIFRDAYRRETFKAAVKKARATGKTQPYNHHTIRVQE
jgi:hypothetical protein